MDTDRFNLQWTHIKKNNLKPTSPLDKLLLGKMFCESAKCIE